MTRPLSTDVREVCRRCNGYGRVMADWRDAFGLVVTQVEAECQDCDGIGWAD